MFCRFRVRLAFVFLVCGGMTITGLGDEPTTLVPTAIDLAATPCGDGWKQWETIGRIEGMFRERITALVANDGDVWVGTSDGRLLTQHDEKWLLQGRLEESRSPGSPSEVQVRCGSVPATVFGG